MKVKILTYFFLLTGSFLHAQKVTTAKQTISSFDLVYGAMPFNSNFYNQFNTIDNFKFFQPIQLVGLSNSGHFVAARDGSFDGHISYCQVIPQTIKVQDSLSGKITGFIVSVSLYGWDLFPKRKNFDLLTSIGFSTGRLRMYENELLRQKNPFFAPEISIQPKIRIKKIVISFITSYDYDISKQSWRRTLLATKDKVNLSNSTMTGFTGLFCFGFPIE